MQDKLNPSIDVTTVAWRKLYMSPFWMEYLYANELPVMFPLHDINGETIILPVFLYSLIFVCISARHLGSWRASSSEVDIVLAWIN